MAYMLVWSQSLGTPVTKNNWGPRFWNDISADNKELLLTWYQLGGYCQPPCCRFQPSASLIWRLQGLK